jgi:hypothetical protein
VSYSYYLGLDLGQSSDYSALSILEEPVWLPAGLRLPGLMRPKPGWASPADLGPEELDALRALERRDGRPLGVPISVRHLERFELGTPYPKVVERVAGLLGSGTIAEKGAVLLVDKTGVGAGVVDMFRWAGCRPVPVTIHGGSSVHKDKSGRGFRVPKRDLVSAVQVLLQNRRLKIAEALAEASTLRSELLNFRVKLDPRTAHDSYEHWREGDHDDLVLATAMACWFRQFWNANLDAGNALRNSVVDAREPQGVR